MLNSKKKEFLYAGSVFGPNLIFAMIMAYLSNAVNPGNIVQGAEYWAWLPTVPYAATAAVAIVIPVAFGIFYTVGRFFDALIDIPIAARLDRMKNRYARIRLPIIIAFIPMVLGAVALTQPLFGRGYGATITETQMWGNTIWFFATSIVFFAASTICTVTFMSSLATVCTDRKQRARVAFYKSFIDTVQFALAYALAPLLAELTGNNIMMITAFLIPTMVSIFIPVILTIGKKGSELAPLVLEGSNELKETQSAPAELITDENVAIAAEGIPAMATANAGIGVGETVACSSEHTAKKGGLKGFFADDAPEKDDVGDKKAGLFKSLKFVFKSKAYWPWLCVIFFTFLGLMLFLSSQNALISGVLQLGPMWAAILNSAAFGPVPIMLYFYNRMLKKKGIRFSFQVSLLCFAIGIACFSLGSAYFFPNSELPRIAINLAGATFSSFAIGSFFMMNAIIPAQVAATEKKVTKRNNSAMYFAGQSIIIGLATALAGGVIWNIGLVGIGDWFVPSTVYGAGHHLAAYGVDGLPLYEYGRRVFDFVPGVYRIPIGGFLAPFFVALCSLIAFGFTFFMPKSYDAKTIGRLFDKNYVPDAADEADAEIQNKKDKNAHVIGYDCIGTGFGVSLFLALFPLTSLIFGAWTRFKRKEYMTFVFNILFAPVFYIIDLICMIVNKRLVWLAFEEDKSATVLDEPPALEAVDANA